VLVTVASLLATTWLAAAAPVTSAESTAIEPARRPNVVLVLVDDARTDDMVTLPKVRRLVGQAGATFTNTVSSFPLCCPARASLLTGQYPHNHNVLGNTAPLGGWTAFDDADTLATWLDPSYHTALIGKYFNQYKLLYVPPGWDTWMIPRSVYDYEATRWSIKGVNQTIPGYQTDTMGKLADFITRRAGATKPFFLYTSLLAPHAGNPAEPDDPPYPTPNVKDTYTDVFAGRASTDPSSNEEQIDDKPIRPPLLTDKEIAGLIEVNAQRR